jgi:CrcB protein
MATWLAIFLGAGVGGALRHGVNTLAVRLAGDAFPYGIAFINVSGSLLMGLVAGWLAHRGQASEAVKLFLTTGILGGYTTFSAFSLDVALLYQRGQAGLAMLYVLASVVLSIGALFVGLWLVRPAAV